MADKKNYRKGQLEADCFRKLPERAQEIWFQYCDISISKGNIENLAFPITCGFDYSWCESPIEIIFKLAYDLILDDLGFPDIPIYPQESICVEDKFYRVDFLFDTSMCETDRFDDVDIKRLVIECDGHEYHNSTKEQVAKGNERDLDLKNAGYDVIHFSGSQIYDKPFACACKTIKYICKLLGVDYGDL